jgi:hypothetical protein
MDKVGGLYELQGMEVEREGESNFEVWHEGEGGGGGGARGKRGTSGNGGVHVQVQAERDEGTLYVDGGDGGR